MQPLELEQMNQTSQDYLMNLTNGITQYMAM